MKKEQTSTTIKCKKCKKEKTEEDFSFRNKKKGKRTNICRACVKEYNAKYREENKESIRKAKQEYGKKNREQILKKHREYYYSHKADRLKYRAEYYKNNKRKERDYMNKYISEREKADPIFRLTRIIKKRIRNAIKYSALLRNAKWRELLGCSVEEVREHIESQFYDHPKTGEKMSWENYGKWEIDHIIPVSSIKNTDDDAIKDV